MAHVPAVKRRKNIDRLAAHMTRGDPLEIIRQAQAELSRRSLREFIPLAWPIIEPSRPFIPGWPIDAVCDHLEAVTAGDLRRLVMTVPPGSMKSLSTRVFWPAWEWIDTPSRRFIGASYASHLAERDNRRARNIITSPWYQDRFPSVQMSEDQRARTNFGNNATGWMLATSVKGLGTGERADRFIIDDPHNVAQAESAAERLRTLNWFRETVPSRLNDMNNDPIIVIMQRVHQEDIAGVAIELGYEHLNIPMHYDPKRSKVTVIGWEDPRTEEDELMWPDRFSEETVEELVEVLGPYAAAAQLEQSPVPRQGGMFKPERINILEDYEPEGKVITVRGWDLAGTEGAGAFTVGYKLAYDIARKRTTILDIVRERLESDGVRTLMLDTADNDGKDVYIVIPQDPGQAGKGQARDFVAMLSGYKVYVEPQTGSKETRADAFAAQVNFGNVDALDRHWTKAMLEEFRFFPMGKYVDQVDAGASAFNRATSLARQNTRPDLAIGGDKQINWARP